MKKTQVLVINADNAIATLLVNIIFDRRTLIAFCTAVVALSVSLAEAACTGASPTWNCSSQADLAALLNGANLQNNDTVNVSPGTYMFDTPLVVNNGKNFSLVGAGVGLTNILQGASLTNTAAITIVTVPGAGITRVSGFTFNDNNVGNGNTGNLVIRGNSGQVRIDHNRFILGSTSPLLFFDYVRGVVDHNVFNWQSTGGIGSYVFHDSWLNVGAHGDNSWASPDTLGTTEAVYFEDNQFDFQWASPDIFMYRFAQDGWKGMRRVDRYNAYHNTAWDMHGLESTGRNRGGRQMEVYNNTFTYDVPGGGYANPIDARGGLVIAFNNTAATSNGSSINSIFNVKQENASVGGLQPYPPFGMCGRLTDFTPLNSLTSAGTTATLNINTTGLNPWWSGAANNWITISGAAQPNYNGTFQVTVVDAAHAAYTMPGAAASPATGAIVITFPWNQNSNQYGHLCMDQTGAGQGNYISGDDPSPVGWTQQTLSPNYGWNNLWNGVINPMTSQNPNHLVENIDYFTDDATQGVKTGTRSQLPATCSLNQGFWVTDEGGHWDTSKTALNNGTLYKCTAPPAGWTRYYTPLIYPHPLASGSAIIANAPAPAKPSGLALR